ncbi:MAG: twin-arginine translocation signal domain-containing protein [Pirellula sp.]
MNQDYSDRDLREEITPYSSYIHRRKFMKAVGAAGTLAASAGLYRWFNPVHKTELNTEDIGELAATELTSEPRMERGFLVDEPLTSESSIINESVPKPCTIQSSLAINCESARRLASFSLKTKVLTE